MEIAEPGSSVNAIQRERNENQAGECSGVNQNAEIGKARLYKAAKDGNFDAFKDAKSVEQLVTTNGNSVLHIYITARPLPQDDDEKNIETMYLVSNFLKKIRKVPLNRLFSTSIRELSLHLAPSKATDEPVNFVRQIVKLCPDLLWTTNIRDETPLHIAARHGHSDIVGVLISQCKNVEQNDQENGAGKVKEMLEMTNKGKDTALHEAVRANHVDVVKKLVQEEPNIPYGANKTGESALYLASVSGFKELVKAILTSCTSPDPYGPKGRTALHGAVLRKSKGITNLILENEEKTKRLTNKADDQGWIPLHYAAYLGYLSIIERLLEAHNSSVYKQTRFGKKTALHLAASRGKVEVLEKLISSHPDCCELVDEREWNVIHFAVESKNEKTIEYVLSHPFLRNLLYQKNAAGNTPPHQLALSSPLLAAKFYIRHREIRKLAFNDLDIILATEEKTWQQMKSSDVGRREGIIVEKDEIEEVKHKSTEFIKQNANQGQDKFEDGNKDAGQTQLIVATLVATVTFAAGFTLPGGYIGDGKPNAGGAVLMKQRLFQVFLAVDGTALMISCCAALIRLFISWKEEKEKRLASKWALLLTFYGLICMMAAFFVGTYAVIFASRAADAPGLIGGFMWSGFIFSVGCVIVLCGIYIPTRILYIEIIKRTIGSKTKKEELK